MDTSYGIAARDYLRRAEDRLRESSFESLFYAGFELRCGIEARMQSYLEVWDHIAKKKKQGWRITDLGRNIENAFRTGDSVVRWAVHDRPTGELIVCLYHTPVTKKLRKRGEKLGNYMHSMKRYRPIDDTWWSAFHKELCETAEELRTATVGTLLGPPLMKKGTRQVQMSMELPPGSNADTILKRIIGQDLKVDVKYLKVLPGALEPQASVWTHAS
jgi:hypothetical protein